MANDARSEKSSQYNSEKNQNGKEEQKEEDDEDEEDYMSMIIQEPEKFKEKETSIQRRARKERQAEINSRAGKTHEDRKADEVAEREKALSESNRIDASNKGFKMLAKLGYKAGEALGKSTQAQARTEPIRPVLKEDRGGIGLEVEKKRKLREEMEAEAKKVRTEQGDYRERMRAEREERRLEAQLIAAQRIAENFDSESELKNGDGETGAAAGAAKNANATEYRSDITSSKPLKSINVLWRGLVRSQLHNERERRMRQDFQQSLSSLSTSSAYRTHEDDDDDGDDDDDNVDIKALGQIERRKILEEEDVEEEDAELDEFNALQPQERLEKVVLYLRETYSYCFWCKYQYPDTNMEGCPGTTEEDHD